jgi:hypothetical protein
MLTTHFIFKVACSQEGVDCSILPNEFYTMDVLVLKYIYYNEFDQIEISSISYEIKFKT